MRRKEVDMLFDFSQKVYKEISRTGYNNKTKLIFWRVFQLFPRTLSPRLLQSQSLPATIPSKHPPLVLQNIILGSFCCNYATSDEHHHYWWPSHAEYADTRINGTGCNCLELQIFIAKTCLDLINVLISW